MTQRDQQPRGPGGGAPGRGPPGGRGADGRGPGGPRRDGPGGGRGRDDKGGGRGGGKGGKGGRGRDERGGASSAAFKVVSELGGLEKAMTNSDFGAEKVHLEEVLKALQPLHLKSLEALDMNARGRMITTLMRVMRQPRPEAAVEDAGQAEATEAEAPAEAPLEAAAPSDAATESPATEPTVEAAASEAVEGAAESAAAAPAAPAAKPAAKKDPKVLAWEDVMFLVGEIWQACNDERRAAMAFAESGRPATARQAVKVLQRSGDWQHEATALTHQGKTRDAAKVLEKKQAFDRAAALYEENGDLKSALRCALKTPDEEKIAALMGKLPAKEVQSILERAQSWERLMAFLVAQNDFDSVAKLYERAKQFDQAAAAWERAGKLTPARKAFERAGDTAAATRVRGLEVERLIQRGDRLGAATLQLSVGQKPEAVATLSELPPPKAFRFMQKLKLDEEAIAYGTSELKKAQIAGDHPGCARWLELLGETARASEAWVAAGRADRALACEEQLGNWSAAAALAEGLGQLDKAAELFHRAGDKDNADRVAALPRPAPAPAPEPTAEDAAEAPSAAPEEA